MIWSLVGLDFSRGLERQYEVRSWQAWYDSTAGPVGTPSSNITWPISQAFAVRVSPSRWQCTPGEIGSIERATAENCCSAVIHCRSVQPRRISGTAMTASPIHGTARPTTPRKSSHPAHAARATTASVRRPMRQGSTRDARTLTAAAGNGLHDGSGTAKMLPPRSTRPGRRTP